MLCFPIFFEGGKERDNTTLNNLMTSRKFLDLPPLMQQPKNGNEFF